MTLAERKRLDHVVLPRRLPGLALLERYFPSPADNVLDAELASFATSGDTILDPWAGTGWTARRAVAHGMRVVAAEASPFAQMAAQAFLLAPEVASVDAAFAQLASSRRVDIPLRQHIEELYASRCPVCSRPVMAEEFIWPRDGDAPGRKVYRCAACDVALGGPDERVAPVDESDYAKLGLEPPPPAEPAAGVEPAADADEDLPPAPMGLIGDAGATEPPPLAPLGEPGGPPPPPARAPDPPMSLTASEGPRYASTVRPTPLPRPSGDRRPPGPRLPAAARPVSRAGRAGRRGGRGAGPVHLAQPVRPPDDRQQDRCRVPRPAPGRRLPPGAGRLPAPRQPSERVSRPRRVAAHQRRPRPPARVPSSPRGERVAPVRGRLPGRAHRPRGPGP